MKMLDPRELIYKAYKCAKSKFQHSLFWVSLIEVYRCITEELRYRGIFREFLELVEKLSKLDPKIESRTHSEYLGKPEKSGWTRNTQLRIFFGDMYGF